MAGGSVSNSDVKTSYDPKFNYTQPLILVTSLFVMWAIALNLNDILIPHLKKACDLTDFQSSLIQSAYFGAYFLAALPAGWLMKKIGYKKGIMCGLAICALGAWMFYPAAETRIYGLFLGALFLMACGATFLEVAANPYVTVLGDPKGSANRLNMAQAFNGLGAVMTPIIGKNFILSGVEHTKAELASMTPQALEAYRIMESSMVKTPYLIIGAIFAIIATLIAFSKLPEIEDSVEVTNDSTITRSIWSHKNLVYGIIAQFFYVGAQVGVASFIIRYAQYMMPGTSEIDAADYIFYHLIGFLVGRFTGTVIMQKIAAPKLLTIFAVAAIVLVFGAITLNGMTAVWCVVLIGYFNSIMFPTIFALAIKGVGSHTKTASSLIVMSIIGGAILPAVMGLISDSSSIQIAFIAPAICYFIVMLYGMFGYKEV